MTHTIWLSGQKEVRLLEAEAERFPGEYQTETPV